MMEGETSWVRYDDIERNVRQFDSLSEVSDESGKEVTSISVDTILPDELLERILAYLPIASIIRAGSVCKRWHELVSSRRFLWNPSQVLLQKPWYFMFTSSDEPIGYAYDPTFRKWYNIDLPCIQASNWFATSSWGMVCFMDYESRSKLYVCNPITKCWKRPQDPRGPKFSDYTALAVSVNRSSHGYTVSIVKSKQVPGDFFQWELTVNIYKSETMTWMTSRREVLSGWRSGDDSVICDEVLYLLIYSTRGGMGENRHGIIAYSMSSSNGMLIESMIPGPCPLTCGRLMNLEDKFVMVGGMGKRDIIKGIGIWELKGREWQQVARMPRKLFQGFGELDDDFGSSGTCHLIYIHSYGAPTLLSYDIRKKQWKWCHKCPVTKRFPLQLFTGFCFQPTLQIAP